MSLLPSFDFPHFPSLYFLVLSPHQGLPPVLPPLPKRPALEKANGATTMFNAGMFQYQQALANMQFQQQAAFIPSGESFDPVFVAVLPSLLADKSHRVSHKTPWLWYSNSSEWLNDFFKIFISLVKRLKNFHGLHCTCLYSMGVHVFSF